MTQVLDSSVRVMGDVRAVSAVAKENSKHTVQSRHPHNVMSTPLPGTALQGANPTVAGRKREKSREADDGDAEEAYSREDTIGTRLRGVLFG